MPSSAKSGYTLSNATVLIGDVGVIGGELDVFCCSTDVTIAQSVTTQEITCDPLVGVADRIDYNPKAVVTIKELNFNPTTLERALGMVASINGVGWRTVGKGTDPATTPTDMSEVDGPYVPVYGGSDDATVALSNTLIIDGQVHMWVQNPNGSFSAVATFVPDYTDPKTALATGELYFVDSADTPVVYFTYTYQPMTIGSIELKNPWNLGRDDVWIRIVHQHANGKDLIIFDFWRCRVQLNQTLTIKSSGGDRTVPLTLVFDVLADSRYHGDSDLFAITIDTIGRTTTPDYGCIGAAWATPVA